MIVITDMKVIKTHDMEHYHPFEHTIWHYTPPAIGLWKAPSSPINDCVVTTETVRGRRFVNRMGIEVVIGWDQQAQNYLGLPFEIFEQMENRRQSDYIENKNLRKQLRECYEMTLWQFIKKMIISRFTSTPFGRV